MQGRCEYDRAVCSAYWMSTAVLDLFVAGNCLAQFGTSKDSERILVLCEKRADAASHLYAHCAVYVLMNSAPGPVVQRCKRVWILR